MSNIKMSGQKQQKIQKLRIALVGKTGVGKSGAGNTILGREAFESKLCSSSVTSQCEKERGTVDGKEVAVVDTPGLFDTRLSKEAKRLSEIIQDIKICICLSSPGPHVFLVVIQLGRFTQEEQDTVRIIQETFGAEAARYTIVLFTHGDQLEGITIEEYINGSEMLAGFIRQCHGGYHVFNNKDLSNHTQVTELLQKIDKMVTVNGGSCYTNEMFKRAEEAIEEEMRRGATREKAERNNEFLKKAFIIGCSAVGAITGVVAGAVAGVAAGAEVGGAVGICVADKCTIQ